MECERDDELGRSCVALVTALVHGDKSSYRSIAEELAPQAECAVHHLTGMVVGVLRNQGDPKLLIAALGPALEKLRE